MLFRPLEHLLTARYVETRSWYDDVVDLVFCNAAPGMCHGGDQNIILDEYGAANQQQKQQISYNGL